MAEHFISLKREVDAPKYRLDSPVMDFKTIVRSETVKLDNVNVLRDWPRFQEIGTKLASSKHVFTELDGSQVDALRRILTKKLAIVQGPPGTGKTFTSVAAIKILNAIRMRIGWG